MTQPRGHERIVCAASRAKGTNIVVLGARHFDQRMHQAIDAYNDEEIRESLRHGEQGFINQWGEFKNREEALAVAAAAGQLIFEKTNPKDELFSEDLY